MDEAPAPERSFGPPPPKVWRALERDGLLLLADTRLPSVATLVAGSPVAGSWWGHPKGSAIWRASMALSHHPDVLELPLVDGKVTFVHRRLWPPLRAVGEAREPWQMAGLGAAPSKLLRLADDLGALRTDRLPQGTLRGSPGAAAKALQGRLLVVADEVHTETGAHAKELLSWREWARRARSPSAQPDPGAARATLEAAVGAMAGGADALVLLPWQSPRGSGRRGSLSAPAGLSVRRATRRGAGPSAAKVRR